MRKLIIPVAMFAVGLLALWCEPALAAKAHEVPTWRHYWDLGWKIANFLILAFLIVKMAKKPIKEFLSNQKSAVAQQIADMEEAKKVAEADLHTVQTKVAGLKSELESFEELLAEAAERDRVRLLEDARNEANLIVERGQLQAEMSLSRAKRDLATEIVELASQLAEDKLREVVTAEDQSRLLASFTQDLARAKSA